MVSGAFIVCYRNNGKGRFVEEAAVLVFVFAHVFVVFSFVLFFVGKNESLAPQEH